MHFYVSLLQYQIGKKEREAARRAQALQKRYNQQKQQEILNRIHNLSSQQGTKQQVINEVKMRTDQNLSQKQILQNANKKKANKIQLTKQEQEILSKQQQKIQEINVKRKEEQFDLQRIQQIQQEYLEQVKQQEQIQQQQQQQPEEENIYQAQQFEQDESTSEEQFIYQNLIENQLQYNPITKQKPENLYNIDQNLPISSVQEEIRYNLQKSDSLLIQTPTGSGKSTQILQILLNGGYQNIFMTQPRKVAVFNVFQRVMQLVDKNQQNNFGYAVRGKNVNFSQSNVKIATEGVLLAMLSDKLQIDKIDCVVLDEVHELSCNMELLLSLLMQIQYQRRSVFEKEIKEIQQQNEILGIKQEIDKNQLINKPLKLVFMSATVDMTKLFQNKQLFKYDIPKIDLKCRLYPIEIHYVQNEVKDVIKEAENTCLNILKSTKNGNILIFLQGKEQIYQLIQQMNNTIYGKNDYEEKQQINEYEEEYEEYEEKNVQQQTFKELYEISQFKGKIKILPLHGGLSFEEQQDIFNIKYQDKRLIIISTNIAESSVTLPDITYVIDSCLIKQKEAKDDLVYYKTTFTSLNSVQQRTGRCGRLGPGKCYRLVTAGQISNFQQDLKPEIQKTDLKDVCLQLLKVGVQKPQNFKFISQISYEELQKALEQLQIFNVIIQDEQKCMKLTEFGQLVINYPLPVRLACISAYLSKNILALSFASVQSVFGFYSKTKQNSELLQKLFDFIKIFNEKSYVKSQQIMQELSINPSKYKEAILIFNQLCKKQNITCKQIDIKDDQLDELKVSITRWYIDNLCYLQVDNTYMLPQDVDLMKINENIQTSVLVSSGKLNYKAEETYTEKYIIYGYLQATINNEKPKVYICDYMYVDLDFIRQIVYNIPTLFSIQQYNNAQFIQNNQIMLTVTYKFKCQNFQFLINNCNLVIDKNNIYWFNWVAILIMSQLPHLQHNSIKIIATFDIKNQNQNYVKLVQFLQQYKINNFDEWISINDYQRFVSFSLQIEKDTKSSGLMSSLSIQDLDKLSMTTSDSKLISLIQSQQLLKSSKEMIQDVQQKKKDMKIEIQQIKQLLQQVKQCILEIQKM